MRIQFLRAVCAALMLAAGYTQPASAQQTGEPESELKQVVQQTLHSASGDENCEACSFTSGGCGGGPNLGLSSSVLERGRLYVGAEYLSVRATFSEAVAFIANTTDPISGDETTVFGELGFNYDSSYRIFAGYDLCECGGRVEFGYTNLTSSGATTSPIADAPSATDPFTTIASPIAELPAAPGQAIQTTGSVDADIFDVSFSRAIPLGSPLCCNSGCGSCGDGCGCGCWCPAWDITWSGGLRYADIGWNTQTETVVNPLTIDPTVRTAMNFNGFGARFGMEGRRYLGHSHTFSLFIKGDISLLLGNVDYFIQQDEVAPTPDSTVLFSSTQIVPVTDIIVGGSAQLSNNLSFTGGYLLSAWHDLGMRGTTATDVATASIPDLTFDDANILGFDGFFLRGEYVF